MNTSLFELLPEVVEVVVFTLGSVALTVSGAYIERSALGLLESGQVKLGAVVAWFGLMAFVFAYLLATDKVRPRLGELARSLSDR